MNERRPFDGEKFGASLIHGLRDLPGRLDVAGAWVFSVMCSFLSAVL